jgi:hypothetical protein
MDRTTPTVKLVRKAGILGIGLDSGDGHTYITSGDDFFLLGGSQATHDFMRRKVERLHKELVLRGKTLLDLTEVELNDIARALDAMDFGPTTP